MTGKIRYRGLCETCIHAPSCTYKRDPGLPVMQCDEFEGAVKETVEKETSGKQTGTRPGKDGEKGRSRRDSGQDRYKGLCKTCDNRETCSFPKPEGGVWHCEEYE